MPSLLFKELSMFAKCQILLGKTRLYYPFNEKRIKQKVTVQLIQNKIIARLTQIIAGYHRYQNITPGKMQLEHRHCNA